MLALQFFNVPDQVVRCLSSDCMDFMMSFVCDSSSRLGRRNVDEIKNHPWFSSLVGALFRNAVRRAKLGWDVLHVLTDVWCQNALYIVIL